MENEVRIKGRLVEIGRLDNGEGFILDVGGIGQTVEIYGLSTEQLKQCAAGFGEEVLITIRLP